MGDREGWASPSGIRPNGLLPDEAASVTRVLDAERWLRAEERIEELIARIQPDKPSEERRNAVADYVQRLIMKCFPCQVFTFGSVPLKTYLPDGDIDLTAFSKNQNLKDTWATEVRDMLESEEKSENAEFRVKEVQYIQAEVKLIKCLVENIVVDISFNQLGGLCTLCFLEEVDHLINQNHLFKRSIILIKAWCYYESRILGAHHGLISTYALETLVLYIFHVFNNSFAGPLEVLYRFLIFFSNFDWDKFCVSLWGPVPITSVPDMTAQPPRKDNGQLLLNKVFLDACNSVYAVFPGGQENQGQPFVSKHFNVVDPLRMNNNLGRSVSKGNFFRIRSAFAFGAKRLARLLECPEENLANEVNQFFMNTWKRHGSGRRPDAPSAPLCVGRPLNSDFVDASQNSKYSNNKHKNENYTSNDSIARGTQNVQGHSTQHGHRSTETIARGNNKSGVSRTQSQRNYSNSTSSRIPDQVGRSNNSVENLHTEKDLKVTRADYLINEVQRKYQFARTRSSPELTDTSNEVPPRGRRNRVPDGKSQIAAKPDFSRRMNSISDGTRSSTNDPSSMRHHEGVDNYHEEELASVGDSRDMHQEEQDLINMLASSRLHGLGSQVQMPMNFAPSHLPPQASPSVLASMGYQKNLVGMVPTNIPFVGPSWGSHMQLPHYFPSAAEDLVDTSHENSDLSEHEGDRRFWRDDQDQSDDNKQSTSIAYNVGRGQQRHTKEHNDFPLYQTNRGPEQYPSLRILPSSSRSKASSESSWDASSMKSSKTTRDRWGRKGRDGVEFESLSVDNGSSQADDDNRDWVPLSTMDAEIEERNSPHFRSHQIQIPNYESGESIMSVAPMLVASGSRQRTMDNSGTMPFAFYFTGPPVPFVTMVPVYNFDREEVLDNGHVDSAESLEEPTSEEGQKPDILHSDFNRHWHNLQYGRFCQNPRPQGPLVCPPYMVPPMYLPWEGPGRPVSPNSNILNQLMSFGPRIIPVAAPLQPGSNRPPPSAYQQRFGDESPRYRGGTGTYLPNLKISPREQQQRQSSSSSSSSSSNTRNHHRGSYEQRNDHHHNNNNDREGNWNNNIRPRRGEGSGRSKANTTTRSDRVAAAWGGESNQKNNTNTTMTYGMYPVQGVNSNGSVVMLYPYDTHHQQQQQQQQLEFGTLGGHRFHQQGSPDEPSSPRFQR